MTTTVKFSEIENAFFFSSTGNYEHESYMNRQTGEFHFISDYIDPEAPPLPDDLDNENKYILIPYKNELDLPYPSDFVSEKMPEKIDKLNEIFSSKGAYRRFKDWLIHLNKIDDWYEYENKATEKALREWCKENNISLAD